MKKNNKWVLITGMASGIGSAIAVKYARSGWNIIGQYLPACDNIKDITEKLRAVGAECVFYPCDFTDHKSLENFVKKIKKHDIAAVVNNAGGYVSQKHFTDLSCLDIQKAFMLNATAPIMIVSALFPGMISRHFGRIVNISSIAAKYGGGTVSMHYGCAKRALEGIAKTLAREGARYSVLINNVRPGVIDTNFHKKFPKDMKSRINLIPVGRMGSAVDVAEMVYYLGSEVNNFITGQTIAVSGGE